MLEEKKIAVVIPAYRVEASIEGVLQRMPDWVDRIFVVDDASPDDSAVRAGRVGDARVVLLRHERNQGVGGAMATGIQAALEASQDIVVKCDGDGQMDPRDIPLLIAPLLEDVADHVKGSRFHHSRQLRSMPKWRFVGNVGLTFLTKLASGYWNVLDPVNGFLATRADVLQKIPLSRLARGFFFETDLLIRLNVIEARVIDVALPARYGDEPSSLSPVRALVGFPPRLAAGLARRIFWRYLFYDVSPVAIFGILGLALFSFGFGFGSYQWIRHALRGEGAPLGTIMVAVLPLILGFQLILQAVVLDLQQTPRPGRKAEGGPVGHGSRAGSVSDRPRDLGSGD